MEQKTLSIANLIDALVENNTRMKEWVNTQIGDINVIDILWVEALPTENISTKAIYMVRNESRSTEISNIYTEYIYNETTSSWEVIGQVDIGDINLENYYNKTEIDELLTAKINQVNIAQKTVNTELDYCWCSLKTNYTPVIGEYVPFEKVSGTFEINNGRVIIKPKQRIQINVSLSYNNSADIVSNILYNIKDYTNDKIIATMQPISNDKKHEYANTQICQYTNDTDEICEIGLYVNAIYSSDTLMGFSSITIQEIGREITIDPVEHIDTTQGIEDTPVGHIISHMGNTAPKHYLICDGSEYNITDYPYLAQHFTDEFGSVNYFGGDGENTFSVPDLRGEFLRGTGTATRDTGSGAEVGEHQNATEHINFRMGSGGLNPIVTPSAALSISNKDKEVGSTTKESHSANQYNISNIVYTHYTSRPTNTAVLYCIKYEPTYYMNVFGLREEVVLWEGTLITGNATLSDSIQNYDYLEIMGCYKDDTNTYKNIQQYPTREITKYIENELIFTCNGISSTYKNVNVFFHFSSDTNIVIDANGNNTIKIYKIVGIKYRTTAEGTINSGPSYTDEELQQAITDIVTEIDKEEVIEEPVEEIIENEPMVIPEIYEEDTPTVIPEIIEDETPEEETTESEENEGGAE